MDKYVSLFENVSVAQVLLWILALGAIATGLYKLFEGYRKAGNKVENKSNKIEEHDKAIDELKTKTDSIDEKIDFLVEGLKQITEASEQREARRLRREILKFSDNLRLGKKPSKDSFEDIFDCNQEYETIIAKNSIKNGFTEREFAFITKRYEEIYNVVKEN